VPRPTGAATQHSRPSSRCRQSIAAQELTAWRTCSRLSVPPPSSTASPNTPLVSLAYTVHPNPHEESPLPSPRDSTARSPSPPQPPRRASIPPQSPIPTPKNPPRAGRSAGFRRGGRLRVRLRLQRLRAPPPRQGTCARAPARLQTSPDPIRPKIDGSVRFPCRRCRRRSSRSTRGRHRRATTTTSS
jgi:hypothetical protein